VTMRATSDDRAMRPPRDGEIEELRARLREAEQTLQALRQGEVDAIVVDGQAGPQVYTLENADRPYRIIVERMQEGALTLSPEGIVLYANRSLSRLLRSPGDAILGRRFQDFVAAQDQEVLARLLAESEHGGGRGVLELSAADGTGIPIYLSVVDLPGEGQRVISGMLTDLTLQMQRTRELAESNAKLLAEMAQRERAEGQLRQAQKMEAVGQLTAGVAHDFNNLLTVIAGNLELIQARATEVRLRDQVETIQRAIHRGVRLTDQLLAFSRQRALRPRAVAINALLRETEPLLRRAVGDEIRVTLALGEAVGSCLIDPAELQASMLNLAINAKDAMPQGGSLTIGTSETGLDDVPDGAAVGLDPAERYVMVAVTDTGHGMPSEIRERAFDPFFTTKEVGKGTGLGLSQVYGFIRQSGGHVTIESAVGAGTTVRLYVPRTDAPGASEPWRQTAAASAGVAQARSVLVVEDDDDVRTFAVDLLQDIGYTAIEADSGPAALRILESGVAVDVVFSDVRMPDGMSGFQLAHEIRRRLPDMPIVLTSGVTAPYEIAGDFPVLRKPFRRDEILQAIEAALNRRAAATEA
jgi:PAS domain S-box-containing protein